MNAAGKQHLFAARQKLQDAAASIKQAATEGELNTTDKKLFKRMSYDVALLIQILDARLDIKPLHLHEFNFEYHGYACRIERSGDSQGKHVSTIFIDERRYPYDRQRQKPMPCGWSHRRADTGAGCSHVSRQSINNQPIDLGGSSN